MAKFKLICQEGCGEVYSAGIPIPQCVNELCISKTCHSGRDLEYLNLYYARNDHIYQHLKMQCPRCGKDSVVIVAEDDSIFERFKTWCRL